MRTHLASAHLERLIHDVNGLLASASLAAERLVLHDDPGVEAQARRISLAIDRVAEMVDGARDGGGADAGLSLGRDEVEALLTQVTSLIGSEKRAGRPFVEVRAAVGSDTTLRCDRVRLFRTLFNLAANAASAVAGNGGGVVSIEARRRGDEVLFEIVDDGPGLPKGVIDRFFPTAGAAPSAEGRIGLGFSNAARFATELGGRLELGATGPDGTRLIVALPHAPPLRSPD